MRKNSLRIICVFQIFILMLVGISVSYNIHQLDLVPFVSAGEEAISGCCEKTTNGSICQNVIYSPDNEGCEKEIIPTKCESYSKCKYGCCIDKEEGLCSTNSPKGKCEEEGGIWDDDASCNILDCQKGCCVLGSNVKFVTEERCEKLSYIYGFEKDFRSQLTKEYECLELASNQSKGACVYENRNCIFEIESECLKSGGIFSEGYLCSNPDLNTTCERQTSISCVDGEEEIYWFDSCGNEENIYSSDKDESWNNGKVLSKSESCGAGKANIDSEDCGNCYRNLGSICSETKSGETSVKDGNYVCSDLNCVDKNGKKRQNGESWCVYDGFIGDGKDVVGSRHWKRMCIDGEIIVEPCADYRGEICVQANVEGNLEDFTTASCVTNEASKCIAYNSKSNKNELCQNNEYCTLKQIRISSDFQFDVCVGKYPKGADLKGDEYSASQDICSMATVSCPVLYVKGIFGGWDCEKNCDCEKQIFSDQMSDLCVSLGDCGTYVNYIGDGTNNVRIFNAPQIPWTKYLKYSEPVEGQFAKPEDISKTLEKMGISPDDEEDALETAINIIGKINSGIGTTIAALPVGLELYSNVFNSGIYADYVFSSAAPIIGSIGQAAGGIGIGMMIGQLAAQLFDIQGDAAIALTVAGAVAGAVGAVVSGTAVSGAIGGGTIGSLLGTALAAGAYAIIVVMVIVLIFKIFGIGDTNIVIVEFHCNPWQAPLGGDNCEKCDDDPLKPCSEYRCESLGQACVLLNENTESPICEAVSNDKRYPKISLGEIIEGFEFYDITSDSAKIKEEGKECVTEFTPVVFSLKTDEYAQCVYSFEQTNDYDDMVEETVEKGRFTKNHTFSLTFPSVDSLHTYDLEENPKDKYSKMNLYVRCRDYYGNTNQKEFRINFCINTGSDLTAPRILAAIPRNDASIPYGTTEKNVSVYLNEPGECKISKSDISYDSMTTKMDCETDLLKSTNLGWECSTKLTDIAIGENKFYIRCKDQPWLVDDVADIVEWEIPKPKATLSEKWMYKNGSNVWSYTINPPIKQINNVWRFINDTPKQVEVMEFINLDDYIKIEDNYIEKGDNIILENNNVKPGENIIGKISRRERNSNSESYVYKLIQTKIPLEISSISPPEGDISQGFEPMTIELEVETKGGINDGKAECTYRFSETGEEITFYDTYSNTHKQIFNSIMEGTYNIWIKCTDEADNIAEEKVTYYVRVDSEAPKVVRIYVEDGELILKTDDEAICTYNFTSCIFNEENAPSMSSLFTTEHSTEFLEDKTYYIKCEDVWENKEKDCTIIVKKGDIFYE